MIELNWQSVLDQLIGLSAEYYGHESHFGKVVEAKQSDGQFSIHVKVDGGSNVAMLRPVAGVSFTLGTHRLIIDSQHDDMLLKIVVWLDGRGA